MRTAFRVLAGLPLLLLGAGCIDLGTPPLEGEERLAVIQLNELEPQITVPQSVRAGQFLTVQVTTFGDTCTRSGRTALNVVGRTAEVRPYDRYTDGTGCAGEQQIRHTAQVRFDDVGTATVNVYGRRMPGDVPVTVTRTVTVTTP